MKHQLADLAAEIEPALSLWWYAAHAFDHMPERVGAARGDREGAPDRSLRSRSRATSIELHGGIGFTWEYDVQLWFRRAIFDRAFLGEAGSHRQRAADLAGW